MDSGVVTTYSTMCPESYGEDKFVILLGGHIETATLATLGDLLDGSGWTNVLTQAGIATP